MARAETMESAGETGGGRGEGRGNGPLPRHTCRMELPCPLHTWPGVLTTTTSVTAGPGALHHLLHHQHQHNQLHLLQPPHMMYPLPHQQLLALAPSSPLCSRREESDGSAVKPSAFSGDESDLDTEEEQHREVSSRRGPLPDLLPRYEHMTWGSPHHGPPRSEAEQELEVRRVAHQLRVIGDQFNARVLRRAHVAPYWLELRDACQGLLTFITQTLSTLYRLT